MAKLSKKELKKIFLRNWGAHEDSCCECDGCKLYDHIEALNADNKALRKGFTAEDAKAMAGGATRGVPTFITTFASGEVPCTATYGNYCQNCAALREGLKGLVEAAKGASKRWTCWTCSANANKCHQAYMIDKSCEFAKWEQALAAARKLLEKS